MAESHIYLAEAGRQLPIVEWIPTSRTLVQWAAASEDYYELHYDKDFAIARGFPAPVVHGRLQAAMLVQVLTDRIGENGEFRKLSVQYRAPAHPGEKLILCGTVTRVMSLEGRNFSDCEMSVRKEDGLLTVTGTATVSLPCNEKPVG